MMEAESEPKRPERRPRAELSSRQRKHLKGLAHHLDPLVRVGQEGLDERIAGALSEALERP